MKLRKKTVHGWPARSNVEHNPFQMLLSEATEAQGWRVKEYRPVKSCFWPAAVWHWHWPEGQFAHRNRISAWLRFVVLVSLIHVARFRRISIVWTAHNIGGHILANRTVEDAFWGVFHKHIAGVHFLSESSRSAAYQRFPVLQNKPCVVTPHGHYRKIYGTPFSRREARRICGLLEDIPTIVFCGKVSAYKGVSDLISAFGHVSGDNFQLLIAGAASKEEAQAIRSSAAGDARVKFVLKHLTDFEIKAAISAADLVVLPYREVTNSGSVMLALSLDRAVLSTMKGSIPELVSQIDSPWVTAYADRLSPRDLTKALDEAALLSGESPNLDDFEWAAISAALCKFYDEIQVN